MHERRIPTLSVPNRSKLSLAAANMESFFSAPGAKPGAFVWITNFAGAPSVPRAFSLPSCYASAKSLRIKVNKEGYNQVLHICRQYRDL